MTEEIAQARTVVTTRVPGLLALEVEVEFEGREARSVLARWPGGSLNVAAELLHRIQQVVIGARSAAGDGRGVCLLHGYIDGYSWNDCPKCHEEKKALVAPKVEKLLAGAGDIEYHPPEF